MADGTPIEWTNATWNPIAGCSVVSPGCKHCYAMKMAARIEAMNAKTGHTPHYVGLTQPSKAGAVWTGKVAMAPEHILLQPLRWKRPRRIFVNSMADIFHEDVPDGWIDRVFAIMALCPQHTFQVLTKRSARMREYVSQLHDEPLRQTLRRLAAAWPGRHPVPESGLEIPLPNVWLGVSVEDQERADERIPGLLATPAGVRFLSCEPLLGPLDIARVVRGAVLSGAAISDGKTHPIGWVIAGGESGPAARPSHPDWFRSLRDQCIGGGVPFFFKQWGEWSTGFTHLGTDQAVFKQFKDFDHWVAKASTWVNGGICLDKTGLQLHRGADFTMAAQGNRFPVTIMHRIGKKAAGALLDGVQHKAFPT